ncbi:MAG: ribose 5-phosphate isomerase B [Christensenellales bacterium]
MKIALANDHTGYHLKSTLKAYLEGKGYTCVDYGCGDVKTADYPVFGEAAARGVAGGNCEMGIVICGTGFGISLAANRVKGIRCVNCSEPYTATMARLHNDANMLSLGARVVGEELAKMIVDAFLQTNFEGGRHQRRLDILDAIDRN